MFFSFFLHVPRELSLCLTYEKDYIGGGEREVLGPRHKSHEFTFFINIWGGGGIILILSFFLSENSCTFDFLRYVIFCVYVSISFQNSLTFCLLIRSHDSYWIGWGWGALRFDYYIPFLPPASFSRHALDI